YDIVYSKRPDLNGKTVLAAVIDHQTPDASICGGVLPCFILKGVSNHKVKFGTKDTANIDITGLPVAASQSSVEWNPVTFTVRVTDKDGSGVAGSGSDVQINMYTGDSAHKQIKFYAADGSAVSYAKAATPVKIKQSDSPLADIMNNNKKNNLPTLNYPVVVSVSVKHPLKGGGTVNLTKTVNSLNLNVNDLKPSFTVDLTLKDTKNSDCTQDSRNKQLYYCGSQSDIKAEKDDSKQTVKWKDVADLLTSVQNKFPTQGKFVFPGINIRVMSRDDATYDPASNTITISDSIFRKYNAYFTQVLLNQVGLAIYSELWAPSINKNFAQRMDDSLKADGLKQAIIDVFDQSTYVKPSYRLYGSGDLSIEKKGNIYAAAFALRWTNSAAFKSRMTSKFTPDANKKLNLLFSDTTRTQ
ncbi:MAG: hypothetical protein NTV30_00215, partial [Chloroflexi bacterium]|nr:hypothetical protein [Chloroflexota bacterium]